MNTQNNKPKWWRLYAILPLALLLLAAEAQLSLPAAEHKLAQMGVVLFVVALMGLWLLSNAVALECGQYDDEDAAVLDARRLPTLRGHRASQVPSMQARQRQREYEYRELN